MDALATLVEIVQEWIRLYLKTVTFDLFHFELTARQSLQT